MKAYIEYFNPETSLTMRVSATREGLRAIRQAAGINAKREYRFRPGQQASRILTLYVKAERTGKWVSGSKIAKGECVTKALAKVDSLSPEDIGRLTPKGREALETIRSWRSSVSLHT